MGRMKWFFSLPVILLTIFGCENDLQNYITTNLFGPPYNLEVEKLSIQGAIDFGFAVDISGDYIIVGAPAEYDNSSNPEAVYIFHKTDIDTWDSGYKLTPSDGQVGDRFGFSVALFGDYAVVGAPYKAVDNGGLQEAAGAAYIFKRTGINTWQEETIVTQQDPWSTGQGFEAVEYALFGHDVDIYGNRLLIAASEDDLGDVLNSDYGAVYAFENTGTWTYDERLTAGPDEQAGARFGISVDINSDYIAVGAAGEDIDGKSKTGAVYIFQFLVDGWERDARLVAPDGEAEDAFGLSVAVGEGFLVASAPQKTVASADFSGKVYIFQHSTSGVWDTTPFELIPETSHENDFFGFPVALRGDIVMVGCVFRDDANTDAGAAYIYNRSSGNTWEFQKTLTPSDASVNTYFGRSIAIGDTYSVIGATHTYEYHANGSAYVFR